MARLPILLTASSILLGCGDVAGGASFTVATWNVHRLFDAHCDTESCGRGFEALPSPSALEGQLDRIANAIASLDADVVLLQEIETAALLEALRRRLEDRYPHAAFGEKGSAASLDVGVLSQAPITASIRHGDSPLLRPDGSPTSFAREVLEVHLQVAGRAVVAFVAHLKSKRDDDPGRRWAEARRLGELARGAAVAHPDALVVLGGDLNDVPGSSPLLALEGGGRLCRVAAPLGEAAATHRYEGVDEAIDHLYVARPSAHDPCVGSARVVGSAATGYAGSDHAALVGTFDPERATETADLGRDPG